MALYTALRSERKAKAPNTEKINAHVSSEWCADSTFTYGHVLDPLKIHRGKEFIAKFV